MQNVQTSLLPFSVHHTTVQVPEGLNLKQIVGLVCPVFVQETDVVVIHKDKVVEDVAWEDVFPSKGDIVGINVIPGKKGGKSVLGFVVAIAAFFAAPYLAGLASGTTLAAIEAGGVALSSQVIYGAVTIGVSMLASLATSMLSSVPKQSNRVSDLAESQTMFIEGASNAINKYGVIPVNLGVNRMFPPQAALPYTETSGKNQYVRQLFTYGYGKVVVSEKKIGETNIGEFDEVEMIDRLEGNLNAGTSLYSNDVYQDGYSVVVSNATGYVTRTTQAGADEFELDLTFVRGLTGYDSGSGNRINTTVEFEIQFAPTETSDWSSGIADKVCSAQVLTIPPYVTEQPTSEGSVHGLWYDRGYIFLNTDTGVVSAASGNARDMPTTPANTIRIASYVWNSATDVITLTDERASFVPSRLKDSSSFAFSLVGQTLNVAAGTLVNNSLKVTDATAESLRISYRKAFPSSGKYDVRIRRITGDSASQYVVDEATLTALKSISHVEPVLKSDISGTAMRIKGTDQLSGSVDKYNVVVGTVIDYYDSASETWTEGVSSNPAAIYRHVLQSPAFVKALPDSRIDLDALEAWSVFCEEEGLTYNKVIDYEASIDDVLNDVAAAGFATKHNVDGVYSILVDNERTEIKGLVTPVNSWNYSGNMNYPELPHALRVQFRNSEKGYETDEIIVYNDDYDEETATEFETVEFGSCTNSDLAYLYGRRYLATAKLQPETHVFYQDFENLTYNRGDKISFINDSVLNGVGQGRIKTLTDNGTHVTSFTIDNVVEIPSTTNFGVRIRHADATGFTYYLLETVTGETSTFTFTTPVLIAEAPTEGSLCAFVEDGKEVELLVTSIKPSTSEIAQITAVNYAPERFEPVGTIPSFESKITVPLGFYQPQAPVLVGDIQSDESVMTKNSDGSYVSRMVIHLSNPNESSVNTIVKIRRYGGTEWTNPDIINVSPTTVVLTGLEDGAKYDIKINYQRVTGLQLLSAPLSLNNVTYIGASSLPSDLDGFRIFVSGSTAFFSWNRCQDVDFSHYVVKFSALTSGAEYKNAQTLVSDLTTNSFSTLAQSGTYFLKAVDILGNESATPALIVATGISATNIVENLVQETSWAGVKDNTRVFDGALYLSDASSVGYYYFDPEPFDLSEVYDCYLSSSFLAELDSYAVRIRDAASVRDLTSLRGVSGIKIRLQSSIRSLSSVKGFDGIDWSVTLEYNYSEDGVTWSGWQEFLAGQLRFRYLKLRLVLSTSDSTTTPAVTSASVLIDMPDRLEKGEDLTCPTDGVAVTYPYDFKASPSVNITLQDADKDDEIQFVSKTKSGFTFKVYNGTLAAHVSRVFDYVSVGYGRVI